MTLEQAIAYLRSKNKYCLDKDSKPPTLPHSNDVDFSRHIFTQRSSQQLANTNHAD